MLSSIFRIKICNTNNKFRFDLKARILSKNSGAEIYHYNYLRTTKDNRLIIGGEDTKYNNLWYNLGYGANGILFAILGGMMLSKLYNGERDTDMKLFKVDRFDK